MDAVLIGGLLIFYVILLMLSITSWIFFTIGLQTMAKREGLNNTWMAWIPFANIYLIGELVKENRLINSGRRYLLITLGGISFSVILVIFAEILNYQHAALGAIGYIIWFLVYMVFIAYIWMGYYYLLKRYTTHALLITLLSVFITQFVLMYAVFALRNSPVLGVKQETITKEDNVDEQSYTNTEE